MSAETSPSPSAPTGLAGSAAPLVVFDRVQLRYAPDGLALDELSFTAERGEFLVVSGASGAGKSSLLRLVAGLDYATFGTVRVAGQDLARLRRAALPRLRQSMGIVLQDRMLLAGRSVLENVALPARVAGAAPAEAQSRAQAALERVGLRELDAARTPVAALSGGEQQRVALARAIVNRPALVLADEPTAHLDAANAAGLLGVLALFARAGVAVIMASHGEAVPLPAGARVLRLERGRVVA